MAQTFFPITPVDVTETANLGTWKEVNVSAHIASGATGVLLHVTAGGTDLWGIRKNGSSDERYFDGVANSHCWAAIGVDGSRIFESKIQTAAITFYLVGYTMAGVTFRTNGADKSLGTYGAWTEIDCSTEAPSATGLIFECLITSGVRYGNIKKNGSSDDRWQQDISGHTSFGVIIGCDGSQLVEGYAEISNTDFFLLGYITDGATFITNATDLSLGSAGSYADLSALPARAVMGFIEVSEGITNYDYSLQEKGSGEGIYLDAWKHCWAFVKCDANRLIEGKIENTNLDFFLSGYATEVVAPTVTHQATTNKEDTTATGNGNITDTGGETCTKRGIAWDVTSRGDPGTASPAGSAYANYVEQTGTFGIGAFTRSLTGLPPGTVIYTRAYAYNPTGGYNWSSNQLSFLTKPAAPQNVAATENASDKVVITWSKSTGATDYHVWRDAVDLGAAGDVATVDDSGADAPLITAGNAVASDGTILAHVALSLSGTSVANGTTHTYKVVASNATGNSNDSTTDTGYRLATALSYQWNRSSADSDADYSVIGGATSSTHNDVLAPSSGAGRYFTCTLVSTNASNTPATTGADRGYRMAPAGGSPASTMLAHGII